MMTHFPNEFYFLLENYIVFRKIDTQSLFFLWKILASSIVHATKEESHNKLPIIINNTLKILHLCMLSHNSCRSGTWKRNHKLILSEQQFLHFFFQVYFYWINNYPSLHDNVFLFFFSITLFICHNSIIAQNSNYDIFSLFCSTIRCATKKPSTTLINWREIINQKSRNPIYIIMLNI